MIGCRFCTDPDISIQKDNCTGMWAIPGGEGALVEREWKVRSHNFDTNRI
jgi:hypothetical protein